MAILNILTAPDTKLKQISEPVEKVDDDIRQLMNNLKDTALHAGNSLGLAAPQVGVLERVIYVDIHDYDDVKRPEGFYPLFMANPKFIERSEKKISEKEACFSVPELEIEVQRSGFIEIEYLDYYNNKQTLQATGYLARVIQHEIDHLNGILTIDYLTPLKKDVARRRLAKIKKPF